MGRFTAKSASVSTSRSRFAVVGTLLAAALALLTVLPTLALDSTRTATGDGVVLTLSVHESDATAAADNAQDTLVKNPGGGVTVWVAGDSKAYNQVWVQLAGSGTNTLSVVAPVANNSATQGYGISVTNASSRQSLQGKRQATDADGVLLYTDGTATGTWAQFTNPEVAAPLTYLGPDARAADGTADVTKTVWRKMENVGVRLPITTGAAAASFLVVGSESDEPIVDFGTGTAHTSIISRGTGTTTTPATDLAPAITTTGAAIATPTGGTPTIYYLEAVNNDEITVRARGTVDTGGTSRTDFDVHNDFTMKVDARGPVISNITPAGGTSQSSDSAIFGATFADPGSGLINDNEQPEYGAGATITDKDGDGDDITANEPLANRSSNGVGGQGNGSARDINIHVAKRTSPSGAPTAQFEFGAGTDITSKGSSSWRTATDGFSVQIAESPLGAATSGGVVYYAFLAKDRVGNVSISGLGGPRNMKNHELVIDRSPPRISQALAGKGYKSSGKNPDDDTDDLKSIKVVFSGGIIDPAIETLDTDTIEASDFTVVRADGTAIDVTGVNTTPLPVDTTSETNPDATVNNVVYLELAENLPPAATPKVSIIGSISDLAGNRVGAGSDGGSITAIDKTAPVFTTSVTGSVTDRVAATGKRGDGRVTIRVTSNEALRNIPTLHVAMLDKDGTAIKVVDSNVLTRGLAVVQGVTNTWELVTTIAEDGLYAVYVTGEDRSPTPNPGGKSAPAPGTDAATLDADTLEKLVLFEIDDTLALGPESGANTVARFVLTPSSAAGKTQTINPFIRINFAEAEEYPRDTHKSVTLTKLTLRDADANETDLLGTEGEVDKDSFLVSLSDLALGDYTLIVNGTDELGNTLARNAEFDFEVTQRPAHTVSLWPGNNLVSLPGDPVDPSIDVVLPASHPATAVLAYAPTDPVGPWLAATREPGGTWSGPLTEIREGHGYWVDTTTFKALSAQLKERGSGEVPPTFALTAGWNLVGVVDPSLSPSTGANRRAVSADAYFASVDWRVAYTYETASNSWTKVTKGADTDPTTEGVQPHMLMNGQGVWVWLEKADVLAP